MANELPTNYPAWITPDISITILYDKRITIHDGKTQQYIVLSIEEFRAVMEKAALLYKCHFELTL